MSYNAYPFAIATSGNQLVFTFTLPATQPLSMPLVNPWYVNIPNMTIKIDRFNNNLVSFGDTQGIITVDFTLSTSPSPAGGLAAWLALVANLIPSPSTTSQYTSVRKINSQIIPNGGDSAIVFDGLDNVGTDVSYNNSTGVFTVNTTGIYTYHASIEFFVSLTNVFYYMQRAGVTVNAAFLNNTNYNTFGGTIKFTAGDTFTIRVQNGYGTDISPIDSIGGITTQFSIVKN